MTRRVFLASLGIGVLLSGLPLLVPDPETVSGEEGSLSESGSATEGRAVGSYNVRFCTEPLPTPEEWAVYKIYRTA